GAGAGRREVADRVAGELQSAHGLRRAARERLERELRGERGVMGVAAAGDVHALDGQTELVGERLPHRVVEEGRELADERRQAADLGDHAVHPETRPLRGTWRTASVLTQAGSAITRTSTLRSRGPSNSANIRLCERPSVSSPPETMSDTLMPVSATLTCPAASAGVSYVCWKSTRVGTSRRNSDPMSAAVAGSAPELTMRAAVVGGTKTTQMPSATPLSLTAALTRSVMFSRLSPGGVSSCTVVNRFMGRRPGLRRPATARVAPPATSACGAWAAAPHRRTAHRRAR